MSGSRFFGSRVGLLTLLFVACHPAAGTGKGNTPAMVGGEFICGTSAERERDALARGIYQQKRIQRLAGQRSVAGGPLRATVQIDVGDVAIIEDDGTLLTEARPFNLSSTSFRFVPVDSSSYRAETTNTSFGGEPGTAVPLGDDDSSRQNLGFIFTFFGQPYTSVQLNSDGNLTFLESDVSTEHRDLGRFISGPPRIAPIFADFDPSSRGIVSARRDPDGMLFAWNDVARYGTTSLNSFSVKLFENGNIEFVYGNVSSAIGIVGISPGDFQGGVTPVDFANDLPTPPYGGSIVEVFSTQSEISETAITRKFFETHPDAFDHLNIFLGFGFDLGGAFAYELPVKNDIRGINLAVEDNSFIYGSRGILQSFLNMGPLSGIGRYPDDPYEVFLGTNSTMGIMGQEAGHRWMAFTPFRDGNFDSTSILGRDLAHWSFFFNSFGSVMEGNEIQDNGAGMGDARFITVRATDTFSLLDQYLIGLVGKEQVPPSFLVENPTGTFRRPSSAPQLGTTFGGERKEITIDSIIAANGPRIPSVFQAPKVFRQGFILLMKRGQTASQAQIQKVQRIRDAWVSFFNGETGGRGWIVTNLQETSGTTPRSLNFPFFQGDSRRFTGIALANWGHTPADVLFTAYDNGGSVLTSPETIINPRRLTIAPGAQVAVLAEQIHGLSLDDPRSGWIQALSSSSDVSGFFLDGDVDQTVLAGTVADDRSFESLYFTRAQLGAGVFLEKTYENTLNIVNPTSSSAELSLQLIDEFGSVQGSETRILSPRGRLAENLSTIFPSITDPRSGGYIAVSSSVPVVGFQALDADSPLFSLPAQPASTATTLYSAQFASGRFGGTHYFTEINFINTTQESRTLQLRLIGNDGAPYAGIRNPVTINLAAGQQYRARGEDVFGLQDAAIADNSVEGSLIVTADGPGLIGDVVFGDPVAERFQAGLPLESKPVSDLVLSQVAQGVAGGTKPYFTGIAIYNPNTDSVSVTIDVFAETGNRTGSADLVLAGGGRISKTLPEFVPAITEQARGYIRISSEGGPIVAFELFGDQALSFLTSVPAQPLE